MAALLFLLLNLADAYLTKLALGMGMSELNPVAVGFGDSMVLKGLVAVLVIFLLYIYRRERFLWLLNLAFFGVVSWNFALCVIGGA